MPEMGAYRQPPETIRVLLAGNPNSGKTSLFNGLTGARQHVGNYPGVTVEKRAGKYRHGSTTVEVLDLPGTYSLSAYTPEERIARDELLAGSSDVIVAVVDSTALSRSLVLFAELLQVSARVVLCLNMSDEARAAGQSLDLPLMERLLGCPVVETDAHRGEGLAHLRDAIIRVATAEGPAAAPATKKLVLGKPLEQAIGSVALSLRRLHAHGVAGDWYATKLLVGDEHLAARLAAVEPVAVQEIIDRAAEQRDALERRLGRDIELIVTEAYFGFVDGLLKQVTHTTARPDSRQLSDRVDQVLVHRVLGLPVFLLVMYGVFWCTFKLGELPMGWIEHGVSALGAKLSALWPVGSDSPLRSLLVDGVIAGVGGVMAFVPNIVLLFLCLAMIEDTGYMARAAFLMDRLMHRFGLHGRSFVPMIVGFGCSVPGIMATRTLEHEHDRLTTMLVLPLMSCGARLTIWMLLIPTFFAPAWRAPALWSLYVVGVVLALLLALLARRTILRGDDTPFVMELPPYRLPTLRAVSTRMGERAWLYLRKAGTVILLISIVMWAASSYPRAPHLTGQRADTATVAATNLQHSIAGRIGRAMEPLLRPMGGDWKIGTALVGAFAAKEVFVAQLGITYSIANADADEGVDQLRAQIRKDYSPLAGYALMLFLLIATPCMATVAITRRESGSIKFALLQFFGLSAIGYIVAVTVYQVGRLFIT